MHSGLGRSVLSLVIVAVTAAGASVLWSHSSRPPTPSDALAEAARKLDYRTVEARLSGDFPHRPLKQSTGTPNRTPMAMLSAAATVQRLHRGGRGVDDLHARGVTHLLLGNWRDATATLDDAVRLQTRRESWGDAVAAARDAALLADLSAAHHARGRHDRSPRAYVAAAEAAERAWRIARTPQTAWNRAVALQALHLREPAAAAWKDYLQLDPDSEWAAEARAHLRNIARPTQTEAWDRERPRLERAVASDDQREIDRIVRGFAGESRRLGEREYLPEWSRESGGSAAGAHRLAYCRAVGRALQRATGESMLADTVAHIDAATPAQRTAIAHALRLYADAMDIHARFELSAAAPRFAEAVEALHRVHSPFVHVARVYWLNSQRMIDDRQVLDVSHAWLDAGTLDVHRYPAVEAYVHWVRGLSALRTGAPQVALQEYERALAGYRRLREYDSIASMHVLVAETYAYLGDEEEAWRHRFATLERIARLSRVRPPLVEVMWMCGVAALGEDKPLVATLFLDRQIEAMKEMPEFANVLFHALLWRSVAHRARGDERAAAADIMQAHGVAARIKDPNVRDLMLQSPEMVSERLSRITDMRERELVINAAIKYAEAKNLGFRAARLRLEQGKDFTRAERWPEAIAALEKGADQLEAQRQRISDEERRSTFLSARQPVYDALAAVLLRSGDRERAMEAVERGRARTLLDEIVPHTQRTARLLTVREIRRSLPADTLLVEYARLNGALAVWLVSRDGVRVMERVFEGELAPLVDSLRLAIRNGDEREATARAQTMFEAIIRPWYPHARAFERLVFVPDDAISRVPFAALRDRATGRFLVERHTISVAPSANIAITALRRDADAEDARGPALIVAPSSEGHRDRIYLAAARGEAADVARHHRDVIVLAGREATAEAFRARASSASLIHFAGHGESATPHLVFAQGTVVHATEIRRMWLEATRLVVLSACDGAAEQLGASSQGASSLARAFLAAGVPAVVGSYWEIDDRAAAHWSRRFHAHVARGLDPPSAVRAAQREMLASGNPETSRLSAWAAFTVVGAAKRSGTS